MAEPLFRQLRRLQRDFHDQPPVHKWQPDLSGDMDLIIRRDGRWIHEGAEIRRKPLVKLFASILKREGDGYFLVTPVEKWRIRVEDVPFIATQVARGIEVGRERLLFTTNTGDIVPLDRDRAWQLQPFGDPPQPVPYIEVRNRLYARISRQVFYQLAEWAGEDERGNAGQLWLHSDCEKFLLGEY